MSFPRYERYKDTGVEWLGEVPEHWSIRRMKTLFEINKRIAGEIGYDILSITQNGIKIKDTESNEGQLAMDYAKYQLVYPGDFAMNHMDLLTGYVDISRVEGVTSPDYRVFSIRNESPCHPIYFLRLFQNAYHQRIFYAFGQGASQFGRWRLPTEAFNEFTLPCPPPSEQSLIANFLEQETAKIDALIQKQQQLIELVREKRQAIISHAVTKGLNQDALKTPSQVDEIGEIPSHWKILRVRHVSAFTTSGPRGWSERISELGRLFVQSGDLDESLQIDFDNCKRVNVEDGAESARTLLANGDIVVCITGAKTGNVAVCEGLEEPAFVNQHLCLIRTNSSILPRFLGLLLKSMIGQTYFEKSQYGMKQGLSLEDVREAPVLLPPISEQREILSFLDSEAAKFDELYESSETAIHLLQERRTTLISAAVTGRIDVRNYTPKEAA